MKRPSLAVRRYRHSSTHPDYLDLRPFGQGRRFFKTKVEADAERLRQITLREKGGREANRPAPMKGEETMWLAHATRKRARLLVWRPGYGTTVRVRSLHPGGVAGLEVTDVHCQRLRRLGC